MVERKAANNKNHQQKLLKISKEKIKQVNSFIKLLRPKVYITDTSSFKNLVQDLTGYNNNNSATIISNSSPPPPPPPPPPAPHNNLETLENLPWDYIDQLAVPETSVETSLVSDSSNDSFDFLNQFLPHEGEVISQQSYQQILMLEPFPILDADHPWYEPEVSIYDYELSGLFV